MRSDTDEVPVVTELRPVSGRLRRRQWTGLATFAKLAGGPAGISTAGMSEASTANERGGFEFGLTSGWMMFRTIEAVLKKYWGYDSFLPLQREAIECVTSGRDSIVVMPTGGGKSLCFQAPGVAMPGMAVVVSPLISLMKDQVDALLECGVAAQRLDSSMSPNEQSAVLRQIHQGALKLLYLAPERLSTQKFIGFLKRRELSLIAVDEAHCVSMWGHDFRPEYRKLGVLKDAFPGVAVHAYTASATEHVRGDIALYLRLENPEVLVGSFDRPNLAYRVERRANKIEQVCGILDRHKGESGIIYCIRRADVDELCAQLTDNGYSVAPYHAGMDDDERRKNQEAFIEDKVATIVATIAFGMGIDKSNVRYVVHSGMPKSLEQYHQETGRAGRDGLEAECCLLYSGNDYRVWRSILGDMEPEAKAIALRKLNDMHDYCRGVTCRHKVVVGYFGQNLGKENCGACDVCLGWLDCVQNSLGTAQKILSCVVSLHQRFGADYTTSVLIGSREERIIQNGHDTLSTYALLSDCTRRVVRDWVEQLVAQGCIRKTEEYAVLNITERGWRVLKGEEVPRLLKPAKKAVWTSRVAADSWQDVDKGLFETLRKLRRRLAEKKNVPAFIVFDDAALRDMARRRPKTADAFLEVRGVGEKKNKRYGAEFIAVVKEYCAAEGIEGDPSPISGTYSATSRPPGLTQNPTCGNVPHHERMSEIRSTHPRAYEAWSEQEEKRLREYVAPLLSG